MGTTRTLQPRGSHKPTRNPQSHRDPKGTKLPAGTHLPPQTYFLTSSTAATALTSSTATTASTMGVGLGDAACGDSMWSPMGSEHPKPTSGSGGGWMDTHQLPGAQQSAGAFLLHVRLLPAGVLPSPAFVPRNLAVPKTKQGGRRRCSVSPRTPPDPPLPPSGAPWEVQHWRCTRWCAAARGGRRGRTPSRGPSARAAPRTQTGSQGGNSRNRCGGGRGFSPLC